MKKENIRRQMRARKALLDNQERLSAAERAFARLEESAAFMVAEHILMYHSLPDELSTHSFLDKWQSRKHFYLPRVNGVNLDILPYNRSRLSLGSFHIEEPTGDETASIDDIDMIIVPAVAYDRNGNRVGRGKGYYDRLLSDHSCHATTVGICYDFQVVDEIDAEPHDVAVDFVITDSRTFSKTKIRTRLK